MAMSAVPDALPQELPSEAAPEAGAAQPAEASAAKVETIDIYGEKIPTAEVAEYFNPSCDLRCDRGALTRGVPAPKEFKELRGKVFQITGLCPCAVRGYKRVHPAPVAPIAGPRAMAAAAEEAPPPTTNPRADQVRRKRARQDELSRELEGLTARRAARTADLQAELSAAKIGAAAAAEVAQAASAEATRLEQFLVDIRARIQAAESTVAAANVQATSIEREIAAAASETEIKGIERLEREIEKIGRQIRTIVAYHPEASDGR